MDHLRKAYWDEFKGFKEKATGRYEWSENVDKDALNIEEIKPLNHEGGIVKKEIGTLEIIDKKNGEKYIVNVFVRNWVGGSMASYNGFMFVDGKREYIEGESIYGAQKRGTTPIDYLKDEVEVLLIKRAEALEK